ncbi:MAG: DUF2157 domain-containing protein [Bacteriovoracaceae bacterium]|nr:DUF2157 domain-containing protein [Bacteriovoracaceae bacterium]
MRLEVMLKQWVENKIITTEQSEKIKRFEQKKPSSSWAYLSILILGASVMGIGVISIIAANWNLTPPFVKLIVNFASLSLVAFGVYHSKLKGHLLRSESLLVLFIILCLASIGLISQVYHTGGHLYQALMFWSLITCVVPFISKKLFVPFIWSFGFFTGFSLTLAESPAVQEIIKMNHLVVAMLMPLICAVLIIIIKILLGEISLTRALRIWLIGGGILALMNAETGIYRIFRSIKYLDMYSFVPAYICVAFALVGIYKTDEFKKAQKIILLFTIICYLVPFHLLMFEVKSKFLMATFTILTMGGASIFFASRKYRRTFVFIITLIGIRFLFLYFQALGGLAYTGFGLIISGLIIIGSVVMWNKYRTRVANWAEGLI